MALDPVKFSVEFIRFARKFEDLLDGARRR
jgi:hypothetical protein